MSFEALNLSFYFLNYIGLLMIKNLLIHATSTVLILLWKYQGWLIDCVRLFSFIPDVFFFTSFSSFLQYYWYGQTSTVEQGRTELSRHKFLYIYIV